MQFSLEKENNCATQQSDRRRYVNPNAVLPVVLVVPVPSDILIGFFPFSSHGT